ncbi:MAG: ABC transporter permease [Ekhidna sp.]|nr:ABC transporter permease [Ekhidna sp.]
MKHKDIPNFAYKLFQWFCKEPLFEELEGDLEESFTRNVEKVGRKKARRIYTKEVIKMLRPSVLRRPSSGPGYQIALLSSYITISVRNLRRQKLFSFINMFSLSVAMSAGLLVIGMISDLMKFDEFHEKKDEIYRVISTPIVQGNERKTKASSPRYLGEELIRQIPGVQLTNLGRRMQGLATANDKSLEVSGIYADEHFFDFLSFELISGSANSLANPYNILLSESFAQKTFEGQNPIGETITIENLGSFQIAGIVADPPQFSHIQFEAIVSINSTDQLSTQGFIEATHDEWETLYRYYNYIYLPGNEAKERVKNWLAQSAPNFFKNSEKFTATFELQPIHKIVPGPNISDSIGPKMIYLPIIILSVIAAAILLSAIFNYTNLSMARSLRRAREVGVRKLSGASRSSIVGQFTIEAIVLSLLSLFIGVIIFAYLREGFISLLPRAEEMVSLELSAQLILLFVAFAIVTGLIAGLSPSLFFARLSSLNALRSGKVLKALSGINLRKGLIVCQFTLSIIFVMAVVITQKQYTYSVNKDLGFDRENILNLSMQGNDPEVLRAELMKLPEVSEVSFSSYVTGTGTWNSLQLVDKRNEDSIWVHQMFADERYLQNLNMKLVAGRDFYDGENRANETSMIVNESFVTNFGLGTPSEALGTVFLIAGNSVEIVGIAKDFIYANLEEPINSFVIRGGKNYQYANLKVSSVDAIALLDKVEAAWESVDSKHRMEASFMDQEIAEYYQFLQHFMKVFGFVGFLAISISCLGLFGMTIYATQTRMKEIGIRKTFGASEQTLVYLLSRGFMKMVGLAILIGTPICYVIFDRFILAQNVYRTQITFVEVGGSILFLMTLCIATIITQTWGAARTNPAKVLRDE